MNDSLSVWNLEVFDIDGVQGYVDPLMSATDSTPGCVRCGETYFAMREVVQQNSTEIWDQNVVQVLIFTNITELRVVMENITDLAWDAPDFWLSALYPLYLHTFTCRFTYSKGVLGGGQPTFAPTTAPTKAPTLPTFSPTATPTTALPTAAPSASGTLRQCGAECVCPAPPVCASVFDNVWIWIVIVVIAAAASHSRQQLLRAVGRIDEQQQQLRAVGHFNDAAGVTFDNTPLLLHSDALVEDGYASDALSAHLVARLRTTVNTLQQSLGITAHTIPANGFAALEGLKDCVQQLSDLSAMVALTPGGGSFRSMRL
jgi:hypothetical protein